MEKLGAVAKGNNLGTAVMVADVNNQLQVNCK